MALFRAIATVGGFTLASRLLGFARDILVAALLGAGAGADAFFVAFKFPNLFRRLFAEGAFSMAFVPMFAATLEGEGEARARAFAEDAMALLFWTLLAFVLVIEMAMPWAMLVFAPGFADEPVRYGLAVAFTRITFPYLLFISLVSLMAGVLNSLGKFAAAAATPILLNLCLIGALLGLTPHLPSAGHALSWGVAAAGALQFVWLYAHAARNGYALRLHAPRLSRQSKTLLKRALPVALGAGVYQINLLIDTVIASFLPAGSISYLFYADRVNQLPLGVIGVAVGTALLPLLSRQLRAGDFAAAKDSQNRALEVALLFTLPAAAALLVMAKPIVLVLFERGAFGAAEAAATAAALAAFALGLPAYVLVKALAPGFFARQDTKTPVIVSTGCIAANVALSLALMGPFKHVGLAMATAATAWLNAGLLALLLHKRGQLQLDGRLKSRGLRMAVATAVMAAALWLAADFAAPWLAGAERMRWTALGALVLGGLAVYGLAAQITGAASLGGVTRMLRAAANADGGASRPPS